MANRETNAGSSKREQPMETQPNPHGEQQAGEMPVETGHRSSTDENVSRNPSTVENRMNPSVVQDPSTDSMFNLADPQSKELPRKGVRKGRTPRKGSGRRKAA